MAEQHLPIKRLLILFYYNSLKAFEYLTTLTPPQDRQLTVEELCSNKSKPPDKLLKKLGIHIKIYGKINKSMLKAMGGSGYDISKHIILHNTEDISCATLDNNEQAWWKCVSSNKMPEYIEEADAQKIPLHQVLFFIYIFK